MEVKQWIIIATRCYTYLLIMMLATFLWGNNIGFVMKSIQDVKLDSSLSMYITRTMF